MSDDFDYRTKFPPVGWIPEALRAKRMPCGHMTKPGTKINPQATMCVACYNTKVAEKARELEALLGLPRLVGSPKQVAFAANIRAIKLLGLFHTLQKNPSVKMNAKADWFRTETDAGAIIRNRMYRTDAKLADIFPDMFPEGSPPPQTEGTETIDE